MAITGSLGSGLAAFTDGFVRGRTFNLYNQDAEETLRKKRRDNSAGDLEFPSAVTSAIQRNDYTGDSAARANDIGATAQQGALDAARYQGNVQSAAAAANTRAGMPQQNAMADVTVAERNNQWKQWRNLDAGIIDSLAAPGSFRGDSTYATSYLRAHGLIGNDSGVSFAADGTPLVVSMATGTSIPLRDYAGRIRGAPYQDYSTQGLRNSALDRAAAERSRATLDAAEARAQAAIAQQQARDASATNRAIEVEKIRAQSRETERAAKREEKARADYIKENGSADGYNAEPAMAYLDSLGAQTPGQQQQQQQQQPAINPGQQQVPATAAQTQVAPPAYTQQTIDDITAALAPFSAEDVQALPELISGYPIELVRQVRPDLLPTTGGQ